MTQRSQKLAPAFSQFYSDPSKEKDKWSLPDCEVFYVSEGEEWEGDEGKYTPEKGWYYQFCFPGCLPESDPMGPYRSQEDAIKACREEWAE